MMKKKMVSFILAAVLATAPVSSASAAQFCDGTALDMNEQTMEPETENPEISQPETPQPEPEIPELEIPEAETPQPETPEPEPEIPETPEPEIPETPQTELPELPQTDPVPGLPDTQEPEADAGYEIRLSGNADVYFLSDLEKLRNESLSIPVFEADSLEAVPADNSEILETGNTPAEDQEIQDAIEAAKEILPEEDAILLNKDTYELLKMQNHIYHEQENVGFYVVPQDGMEVDKVIAYSSIGEFAATDYGNGRYEFLMPASDVSLDIQVKTVLEEPETDPGADLGTEPEPTTECTCLCENNDVYIHDWDCDLFLEAVVKDCTCGSGNAHITEHDFSCDAVKKAFAAVCTCGIGGMDGVMHDDCEILSRLHKELCGCTEECRTIEAAQAHGEDSAIYQYLIKWSEYCNQPVWAYDNPDAMQGDKKTSPIASLVGDTVVEDKNYVFSFGFHSGSAPNGGYKDFNPSGVKKITVPGQGSDCYDPVSLKGKTVSRRYYNVGVYNGKKVDVELFLSDPLRINTDYKGNDLKPFVRFYNSRIGIGQGLVHDIRVQFKFYLNNTNTEVKPKGHITIKDLDGSSHSLGSGFRVFENNGVDRLSIYNKKYTIGTSADKKKQLTHLAVGYRISNSSGKAYTLVKGRRYYNGSDGRVETADKKGWASIYFNGSFIVRVQLGDDVDAPLSETGANRHAGVFFDTATTIGTYTPDAPAKRCGPTGVEYDSMGWHNTTDGNAASSLRPLETVPGGTYKYGIRHTTYPMAYSSYSMTDKLDTCLTYADNTAYVMNEAGEDITSSFHIAYNASSHTITFTPKSLDLVSDHKQVFSYYFNVKLANAQTIINHKHHENTSYYYIPNTATVNVNGQNLNTNITYFRGQIKGSYHIKKFDKKDNKILTDAVFELYQWDKNQNKYVILKKEIRATSETGLYDTNVLIYTSNNQGKFRLVEKTPPQGYDGGWSKDFTLFDTPSETTFDAPNEMKPLEYGTVSIIKKDKYTNEVITPTDGEFQVYQWSKAQNKYLNNLGVKGRIEYWSILKKYKSENLLITEDNLGKFKVVETKNPTGYEGEFEKEITFTPGEELIELELEAVNDPIIPPIGEITVTKKIKASDIIWAHGNPVFRFKVEGTDVKGKEHTYEDYVEFTKGSYAMDGEYAVMQLTFSNIPIGTYTVSEHETVRYKLEHVSADTPNVNISGTNGIATLSVKMKNAGVTFQNKKTNYDGYSHSDVIKNQIPIQW